MEKKMQMRREGRGSRSRRERGAPGSATRVPRWWRRPSSASAKMLRWRRQISTSKAAADVSWAPGGRVGGGGGCRQAYEQGSGGGVSRRRVGGEME